MVKIFTFSFLLLALISERSLAQQNSLLKYIGRDVNYADMTEYYSMLENSRFRQEPEEITIYSSKLFKTMADKGQFKNIQGARIYGRDTDITAMIEQLKKHPAVRFISFSRTYTADYKQRNIIVPDNIKDLKQLEGIEIASTNVDLAEILPKLKSLKKLSAISLSVVQARLPKELLELKQISSIGLNSLNVRDVDISKTHWQNIFYDGSNVGITQLNADLTKLAKLSSLKHLELFSCNFSGDLSALSKFNKLRSFKISGTTFGKKVQLFRQLALLPTLQALSIRFVDDSTQTLNGLEKLKELRQLTIESMPSLVIIPATVGNLSNLTDLKIYNCPIKQLPLAVFQLPNLEHLDLYAPQLTSLPEGDFTCKKLKSITIPYAKLTKIPNSITSLNQLETINLSGNQISTIPENGWEKLTRLKDINLTVNRLKVFPGGLQQIQGLKSMSLGSNQIDSMPDLLGNNYQLTYLDLSRNKLRSLPDQIGKYDQLQMLYIGQNSFTELPASLGNCNKLRVFDAEIPDYIPEIDKKDVRYLKALPDGLQNTPNLQVLKLSRNKGIDGNSVFNVILATPRQNFVVELTGVDLTVLPASSKWKDININRLVLDNNKLTTLPAEFATIKKIGNVKLFGNLFPGDVTSLTWHEIKGKGDLKVLYYDIGIPFPDTAVTDKAYAGSLIGFLSELYSAKKYTKAVEFADRALVADSATYYAFTKWDVIGTCRYRTKDYKGAIADFERFIEREDKGTKKTLDGLQGVVGYYKANAHITLGQLQQAAKTHEYFVKRFNESGGMQSAAIIYKEMGRKERYQQIMDSVMASQLVKIELAKKKNNDVDIAILDHAETLIIAGRQNEAIKLMDYQPKGYSSYNYPSTKKYLVATGNYLNDPAKFDQIKNELTAYFKTQEKVLYWDFEMFNSWVTVAVKDPVKRAQLMELEEVSKYK